MRRRTFLSLTAAVLAPAAPRPRTTIAIHDAEFWLNGRPTYPGRTFRGAKIQGLLLNSRMVQGIFDDANPATRARWAYPDTRQWDPDRNTREFLAAMPDWRAHGLLSFTINLQGGSPEGYSKSQPWENSAYDPDGTLRPAYMARLAPILDRADELGMAPIVGLFYFGQAHRLADEAAVKRATVNAIGWLQARGYRNILVEIANETGNSYHHEILKPDRIHELITFAKSKGFLAGVSYGGGKIPLPNAVKASDFLLIHGNGVSDPEKITAMVNATRQVDGYRPMPILFNEDDHFLFDQPHNNFLAAIEAYASWGYFEPGESNYIDGYQCPPVNWRINTPRKQAFFALVSQITGSAR